jgi:hypothetical protein
MKLVTPSKREGTASRDDQELPRQKRIDLRLCHARETIAALTRLRGPKRAPEDLVQLHELHARHERELGHPGNAARAETRARNARQGQKQ